MGSDPELAGSGWRRRWTTSLRRSIATFTGVTPRAARQAEGGLQYRSRHQPLRILFCTDAAREGINLQARCHDLIHFDLPWNPARLEQRNGRIDRKLQPAAQVFCRYFVYQQRPEDIVLEPWCERPS